MKTATLKRTQVSQTPIIPYPNAATKQEMMHKALDLILIGTIGGSLGACLVFFLALA